MLLIALIVLVWLVITALVAGACWTAAHDAGVESRERQSKAAVLFAQPGDQIDGDREEDAKSV
jgi:hypothetical protein